MLLLHAFAKVFIFLVNFLHLFHEVAKQPIVLASYFVDVILQLVQILIKSTLNLVRLVLESLRPSLCELHLDCKISHACLVLRQLRFDLQLHLRDPCFVLSLNICSLLELVQNEFMLVSSTLVDTNAVVNLLLPCRHLLHGLHRLTQQLIYNIPYPRLKAEPIQLHLRWVQSLHLILQLHVLTRRCACLS